MLKEKLKIFIEFNRKERLAAISLISIMLGIYIVPKYFSNTSSRISVIPDSAIIKAIDTLQRKNRNIKKFDDAYEEDLSNHTYQSYNRPSYKNGELFSFNPNTLDIEGWKRLGLSDRISKIVVNYRNKGGKFYKKEDILKIWGMPEGFFERIKDYVEIPSTQSYYKTQPFETYKTPERVIKTISPVNINEADTTAFIALPGIGSTLSNRIINFRNKLGGFYSIDQIAETYGLRDSVFLMIKQYLVLQPGSIRKININTATKEELKAHPYIKWQLANAIVEYRVQHGLYTSLESLKNITIIDDAVFNKISNYLEL